MVSFNPYKGIRRTEPDMRREMNNTLDGIFPEISKKQPIILRRMRKDANGHLVKCDCVDEVTKEPDKDTYCPFCQGDGHYWDENYIDAYKVSLSGDEAKALGERLIGPGLLNIPLMVFYTRSTVDINITDKIVEMSLDKEGQVAKPIHRNQLYRIGEVVDYRSDNGRLEYWKICCYGESRKFLNGPRG